MIQLFDSLLGDPSILKHYCQSGTVIMNVVNVITWQDLSCGHV